MGGGGWQCHRRGRNLPTPASGLTGHHAQGLGSRGEGNPLRAIFTPPAEARARARSPWHTGLRVSECFTETCICEDTREYPCSKISAPLFEGSIPRKLLRPPLPGHPQCTEAPGAGACHLRGVRLVLQDDAALGWKRRDTGRLSHPGRATPCPQTVGLGVWAETRPPASRGPGSGDGQEEARIRPFGDVRERLSRPLRRRPRGQTAYLSKLRMTINTCSNSQNSMQQHAKIVTNYTAIISA